MGGRGLGSERSTSSKSDFWYDVAGWGILIGIGIAWVSLARDRSSGHTECYQVIGFVSYCLGRHSCHPNEGVNKGELLVTLVHFFRHKGLKLSRCLGVLKELSALPCI